MTATILNAPALILLLGLPGAEFVVASSVREAPGIKSIDTLPVAIAMPPKINWFAEAVVAVVPVLIEKLNPLLAAVLST